MNNTEQNPPAFPVDGMSLLDYFAGQALPAVVAEQDYGIDVVAEAVGLKAGDKYDAATHWPMFVAKKSYDYASAMLAERTKRLSAA